MGGIASWQGGRQYYRFLLLLWAEMPEYHSLPSLFSFLTWRTSVWCHIACLFKAVVARHCLLSLGLHVDGYSCSVEDRTWTWLLIPLICVLVFPLQQTCEIWKFRFSSFSDKWQCSPSPWGPIQKTAGRATVTCHVSLCSEQWNSRSHCQGPFRSKSCAWIRNNKARERIPITEAHAGRDLLPACLSSARGDTSLFDSFQMSVKKVYEWNEVVCNLL